MSWKYWAKVAFRNVTMTVLLVIVWHHSHWSVALSITLLSVAMELQNILEEMRTRRKKLEDEAWGRMVTRRPYA